MIVHKLCYALKGKNKVFVRPLQFVCNSFWVSWPLTSIPRKSISQAILLFLLFLNHNFNIFNHNFICHTCAWVLTARVPPSFDILGQKFCLGSKPITSVVRSSWFWFSEPFTFNRCFLSENTITLWLLVIFLVRTCSYPIQTHLKNYTI